eukprot:jgi/Picsp_1/4491/NSC_06712-R1_armadillo beta-catenin-like repeat-containing protein
MNHPSTNGEVRGDPLTLDDIPGIFSLLSNSLSHDHRQQKEAEGQLRALEIRPNFCSCLLVSDTNFSGNGNIRLVEVQLSLRDFVQEIVSHKEADQAARWLASVYLKNMVSKYWRSRVASGLSPEEKKYIRGKFFQMLDEEDDRVAIQIVLCLAKVGRADYPKEWPSLLEDVFGYIQESKRGLVPLQGSNPQVLYKRGYLALYFLLKELSSKRLAQDQRNFESLTASLYEHVWLHWTEDIDAFETMMDQKIQNRDPTLEADCSRAIERLLLQLKCLRRMLLSGYPSDARTLELAPEVAASSFSLLKRYNTSLNILISCRNCGLAGSKVEGLLQTFLIKLLKCLRQIQDHHPWSFIQSGSLIPFLDMLYNQCSDPVIWAGDSGQTFIKGLLTSLYNIIRCPGYRGSTSSLVISAGKAKEQKLKLEKMAEDVQPLLRHYWSSKDSSLLGILMDENGEELHQELEHSGKEETIRGCAELVFIALLQSNRSGLSRGLVEYLDQISHVVLEMQAPSLVSQSSTAALHAASVLHAVSIGSYELFEYLNFKDLLHKSILPLISKVNSAPPPLRRESLKMISQWTSKLQPQDKPHVYGLIVAALHETDPVIHLMACRTMQDLMEDWDFDSTQFSPHIHETVNSLIQILSRSVDYESQLEVFSLLNLVIDHIGEGAQRCAPVILHMIASLWDASEGQSLLRIQIMLALQRLVHALGKHSEMAYPVTIPILLETINVSGPESCNTLEDGILLWIVVLRHAEWAHPDLINPLSGLLDAMTGSTEFIVTGCRCIASCCLLFEDKMLLKYGDGIARVLGSYIGTVKDKAMLNILPTLDMIIQACPVYGIRYLGTILGTLLLILLGNSESVLVAAHSLPIYARIALSEKAQFIELFQYVCQLDQTLTATILERRKNLFISSLHCSQPEKMFIALLDLWLEKFDSIGPTAARKLAALGLISLLDLHLPGVLERLDEIMSHAIAVWHEIEGPESEPEPMGLSFAVAGVGPRDDHLAVAVDLEEAEGEKCRRRVIFDRSVVNALKLADLMNQKLDAVTKSNRSDVQQALISLDPKLTSDLDIMLSRAN